jgi:hypothetical protein
MEASKRSILLSFEKLSLVFFEHLLKTNFALRFSRVTGGFLLKMNKYPF